MKSTESLALRSECYAPAAGVRLLRLGGRNLVYAEDRQQVVELNETADRIWRALSAAGSVAAAAEALVALGVAPRQARRLVQGAAVQWTRAGYLAPRALDELLADGRDAERTLVLDELAVELRLRGVGCAELDAVFGHFYASCDRGRAAPARQLSIIDHAGGLLFYLERRLVLAGSRDGLAAHVKAILTELYADGVENGFLIHGALLQDGGRRLLLCGAPGAGKTTLALALAAAGWRYGGDDIVRLSPAAAARGVPFAAAVKTGSLALLREAWPQLGRAPAWLRADGQQARYLLPTNRAPAAESHGAEMGPLDIVVTLARQPGATAAARPISAVEALSAILGGAYARRWRMTGEALDALAQSLDRAVCVQLEYSDLGPAVQALAKLARVQAQAA